MTRFGTVAVGQEEVINVPGTMMADSHPQSPVRPWQRAPSRSDNVNHGTRYLLPFARKDPNALVSWRQYATALRQVAWTQPCHWFPCVVPASPPKAVLPGALSRSGTGGSAERR